MTIQYITIVSGKMTHLIPYVYRVADPYPAFFFFFLRFGFGSIAFVTTVFFNLQNSSKKIKYSKNF